MQVDDHNGGVVSQDVTITVTGTNDTPVITSAAQGGTITEETNLHQPNPTGSSDADKANGAVTFTDVDLSDQHQVTVTGVVASGVTSGLPTTPRCCGWLTLGTLTDTTGSGLGGSQPWNFAAQDKNFDYPGGRRDADADLYGAGRRPQRRRRGQDVTITVTGTNDTPVMRSPAATAPLPR